MKQTLQCTLNGQPVQALVEPRTSLADFLRDERQLTGTHVSCEQGVCGACTVLMNGRPVRSCITWAVACEGAEVRSIEGLDDDPLMQRLREAFTREHALQCGFCTPGMLITSRDIVQRLPGCDESRVRHELSGNLCRCTGYQGIVRAVCAVASDAGSAVPAAMPQPAASRSRQPLQRFEAVRADGHGATGAAPASQPDTRAPTEGPIAQVTEHITVQGCDAQRLWALLSDVSGAAGCLPGAQIDHCEGNNIHGSVAVAFGPMKAHFKGQGSIERDESRRQADIEGMATDTLSKTRAQARITYRVEPDPRSAASARLVVGMRYDVQGPLAQFSRSDLVRSLVAQLLQQFGRNLEALAAGRAAPAAQSLSAFGLLWAWLRDRLQALLGRR